MDGDNILPSELNKWSKCTFYDSICYSRNGGLLIGASSLTHRYWTGKLIYIESYNFDACKIDDVHYDASTESSITNVQYLNRHQVLTTHDSGSISMWQLSEDDCSITPLISEEEHDGIVSALDISVNQTQFATGSHDCSIKIWNADECMPLATHSGHIDAINCLAFSLVSDDIFLSGSLDKRIFLWDLRNSKPASIIGTLPVVAPTSLAWIPNREYHYMIGTEAGEIVIMDTRSNTDRIKTFDIHDRSVSKLAFPSSRSTMLASSSYDTSVALSLYNPTKEELKITYKDSSHKDVVRDLAWNSQNNQFVSCSWDSTLKIHEAIENRMEVL